jgi:hypothetical protein
VDKEMSSSHRLKPEAEIQARMQAILLELVSAGLPVDEAQCVVFALERICSNCISEHIKRKRRK